MVIIIVLLLVDVAKPFFHAPVAAAPAAVQYKVATLRFNISGAAATAKGAAENEATLNELGRQGWEAVASIGEFVILKK
jgi:hypothetical protein